MCSAMNVNKLFRFYNAFSTRCGSPFSCYSKRLLCSAAPPQAVVLPYANDNFLTENRFAHMILETHPSYSDMVIINVPYGRIRINFNDKLSSVNWKELAVNELVQQFETISRSAEDPINHPSCADLRAALRNHCQEMTDDQLGSVLHSLGKWPFCQSPRDPDFLELWNDLDMECLSRWKKWDLNRVFYFMELWYALHLTKQSGFVFKAATKLATRPDRLTKEHIVILLFHLSIMRTASKNISLFEIESRLTEVADELTVDELAVAMMGFFKSDKSLVHEKLMNTLIDKLLQEIKNVPDISLTAIIKELRKCLTPSLWHRAVDLADAINEEVNRLSMPACSHAALFLSKPQLQHKPLLTNVAQKLAENVCRARLKDIEKVVFPLVQTCVEAQTEPNLYSTIMEEFEKPERIEETETYPKSFVALTHYLCLAGVYPEKWIQKILDPDFITQTYGPKKFVYGRELLWLDCGVELECPNYTGPRLSSELRTYLSKKYAEYIPDPTRKLSQHQKSHYDIAQTAEALFGKQNLCQKYLLPQHSRADIVVHLDENKKPLPLAESLVNQENFESIQKAPEKNYFALMTVSKNMCLYKSSQLNGESNHKKKCLQKIGYTPVLVYLDSWPTHSTMAKVEHLRNLIQSACK